MSSYHVQTVVVGAGVIGLAIARHLALRGGEVLVVDAETAIGTGTSSRNSEVIHAGIYYPEGSLKARLCVEGRRQLAEYCAARGIAHRWPGKIIVATTDSEIPELEKISRRAAANDVPELVPLAGATLAEKSLGLRCVAALWSPVTGIIDSHALMLSLLGDAEDAGAVLALRSPVIRGEVLSDGFMIETGGADPTRLFCRTLINAAGLRSVDLARQIAGVRPEHIPERYFCRGHYFTLSGAHPFRHLVYPVPEQAGLGIHLTLDLAGQARFGPDTEWVETPEYTVDPALADKFAAAIRRYWPGLPDQALNPGYSGIRPKISPPGAPAADFRIDGPAFHQIPGLVNLFGIESPGLTSCLAIAALVGRLLPT